MNLAQPFPVALPLNCPFGSDPLQLACFALDEARGHLLDYAHASDNPAPYVVDATDLLDHIFEVLAGEVKA